MVKLIVIFCLLFPVLTNGETGVTHNSIIFGQSAVLLGESRHIGINMKNGILAAFSEINQKGGIYGRKLKLISLNDSYEPELAVKNTRKLIKEHKIFALIGGVGTPTSKAVAPIVSEVSIPYIGPFTGAEFLRKPKNNYVINVRASYYQEINHIVERLINDRNINRISILYQDDSFGRAGLDGLKKALQKKNKQITSQGVYIRNTKAVKTALLEILVGNPEAVVIVGSYGPTAKFIQLAESINFNPIFICLSFVGTSALLSELKDSKSSVVITQVVPFPFNSNHSLVSNYQKAIKEDFNFVSLEGYLVGRLTALILQKIGKNPTRNKFLEYIKKHNKPLLIDDFPLQYEANDNQGSDKVFFSAIVNNKLLPLANLRELYNGKRQSQE